MTIRLVRLRLNNLFAPSIMPPRAVRFGADSYTGSGSADRMAAVMAEERL